MKIKIEHQSGSESESENHKDQLTVNINQNKAQNSQPSSNFVQNMKKNNKKFRYYDNNKKKVKKVTKCKICWKTSQFICLQLYKRVQSINKRQGQGIHKQSRSQQYRHQNISIFKDQQQQKQSFGDQFKNQQRIIQNIIQLWTQNNNEQIFNIKICEQAYQRVQKRVINMRRNKAERRKNRQFRKQLGNRQTIYMKDIYDFEIPQKLMIQIAITSQLIDLHPFYSSNLNRNRMNYHKNHVHMQKSQLTQQVSYPMPKDPCQSDAISHSHSHSHQRQHSSQNQTISIPFYSSIKMQQQSLLVNAQNSHINWTQTQSIQSSK